MNYKLAKQLKDAGFPQEGEGKTCYCENHKGDCREYDSPCNKIHIPTLHEIIEACREQLDEIIIYITFDLVRVKGVNPTYGLDLDANGSTTEEAVAMLWLELNNQ